MITQQKFPKDFLWGASTASHQVEGGTVNQWSAWELAHASQLASTAEKELAKAGVTKLADWPAIRPQATDPENYISGAGVDHYNRYEQDFDLLEQINLNAFRFGIEWSRVEPEPGVWNLEAIRHYHDYIDSLNARGITPVLNIWHWTMPTWFTDLGGFEQKGNVALFAEFVAKIAEEYADKLQYVITINEPNVYSSFSYLTGAWPPQQKKPLAMIKVARNLAQAHRQAYAILKAANPALQIGIAAQLANIQAKRPHNLIDGTVTKLMRYGWNWWFLNRVRRHQDFVGINYYFTDYYHGFNGKETPHVPLSDLAWYMEPEGLYPLLTRTWARYKKPIIVTENGVADGQDQYRRWWLEQTVVAMERAMSDGVDLRGYLHWSLLDNFEWAYGWWPKFGLVAVDRDDNMRRSLRPSAEWFGQYVAELRRLSDGGAGRAQPSAPVAPRRPAAAAGRRRPDPSTSDQAAVTKPANGTAAAKPLQPLTPPPAVARLRTPPAAPAPQASRRASQAPATAPADSSGARLDLSRLRNRVQ